MSTAPCPRCSTPYTAGQEYCLECGLRLPPPVSRLHRWSTTLSTRYRWFPGEWIWPALLALVIAVIGAAAAIAASDEQERAPAVEVATGGSETPTTTQETLPTAPEPSVPATTAEPPPATTQPPATTAPPRPTLVTWPRDGDGWTIVLISLPQSGGLETARSRARQALASGLPEVGVLNSSRFGSLHPGYYVVFSGLYDSQAEATSSLPRARGAYPAAYTRRIAP